MLQNIEIVAMQYGKGDDKRSDMFWEALAHKTWSYRLPIENPEDIKIVITAAVYRGQGKEVLEVCIINAIVFRSIRHAMVVCDAF